jgi:hypothetical protein
MKRATSATFSALTLLSLAALTACGGASGSGSDADPAADKPSSTEARERQLTPEERLKRLVITEADVNGMKVSDADVATRVRTRRLS